jgi:glycosyltransferase involved in cell wall biosynthesis
MGRGRVKILVLSFYFRPDLSACSFRTAALVSAIRALAPAGSQIDVITTLPNRYHSFAVNAPTVERVDGISISRIVLPKHRSGLFDQSRAFLSFSRGASTMAADIDYDIVFATSSRLMTAALGAWIARRCNAKLYLDIRDIFVDTIHDILPGSVSWAARPVFSILEKWVVKQADKVNLVSPGFSEYFSSRYPRQRFSYYTNGIDEEFMISQAATRAPPAVGVERPLTVLYAGNIGEGQGLHTIVPRLAKLMGRRIRFKIIGDGGRKHALELAVSACGVTNIEVLHPLGRAELLKEYRAADVLFVHLNDHNAFKKVLPSKIFEYAALGKPVWAGVSGYAAQFVRSEISNSAVFPPCDVNAAVRSFDELNIHDVPRTEFLAKYARSKISLEMANDILAVAGGS